MNSKGHLVISIIKSCIRVASCIIAIITTSVKVLAVGLITAEILGIVEECVDKR